MEDLLKVQSVNMTYIGGYTGLVDINFTLHKGEILVFVGKKYSGKTNLARVIAGLERITSGSILLNGKDIKTIPLKDRNFALSFNESSFNPKQTLYENLSYPMSIRNFSQESIKEKVYTLAKLFSIDEFLNKKIKDVPKKAIEIALFARMFTVEREIYIVDDAFRSFDMDERQKIYVLAKQLSKDKSIIFLTDDFDEGLTFTDKVYILDHCKIVDYANYYTTPNHIATAEFQGGEVIYATMRKIDDDYYLDIMEEDIKDQDEIRFLENKEKGEHLIRCNKPISDIYIDKNILAIRNQDQQIDTYNYYDLVSMYNIALLNKEL